MRICFIYPVDIRRHRSADPLFELKNIAAAKRLDHEPVFVTPQKSMSRHEALRHFNVVLQECAIVETFSLVQIPQLTVLGRGQRSFGLFATIWSRMRGFDLVWSRDVSAADFASLLGLPTIIEHHTVPNPPEFAALRRISERRSLKAFVAISAAHKQIMASKGIRGDKIVAAHSGVDMSQYEGVNVDFRRGATMGLEDRPLGLYAGSLYPGRGIEQILEAARKLTGVYFLCVGGRDFEVAQFRDKTRALDLRNVRFLGHLPNAEVPRYLLAADILLAPYTEECQTIGGTRTIAYASPMKLFEYMAAGKPIITSNIGAIPEVIRHEENGLLVTPGSVDDLVRATVRLLNDPPLARRLGDRAREDARQHTWEARVTRILTFAGVG